MTTIGILSDTHGYLDERVFTHFAPCDEIWHAGDIGSEVVLERLRNFKPTRAVFGNMDSGELRFTLNEIERFKVEQVHVFLTHIGGYPGRYNVALIPYFQRSIAAKETGTDIEKSAIDLFVCGHSHILKVQFDKTFRMLTINPGAAGKQGWQPCQTLVRLTINQDKCEDLEVIELR